MNAASKETTNPFDIIEEQRCSIETKDHQIRLLEEKVNYLLHHRFGRKSEQANDLQGRLFGEDEKSASETIIETLIDVPSHKRKKGGRRKPPTHLPRIRIEHDLPEEQKLCSCGAPCVSIDVRWFDF